MHQGRLLPLGLTPYLQAKEMQLKAVAAVNKGEIDGVLILVEHPPVYTVGRSGGFEHLLLPEEELARKAEIYSVERGGSITFHGPGQLVAYPVLNLRRWKQDVHWYVHSLEEAVIRLLVRYGVHAGRKSGYPGVWVGTDKVCALGVSVRNWVTWHGIALNISTDLDYFKYINPCGLPDMGVTSLKQLGVEVGYDQAVGDFLECFQRQFQIDFSAGGIFNAVSGMA